MSNQADFKSFTAAGAIKAKSLVKYTTNRWEAAQASAATDKLAGVGDLAASAGQMVDVAQCDNFEVTCGAVAIAAGAPVTADADGLAITAVAVAGQTIHYVGFAQVPAVPGDIFPVLLARGVIVTPAAG